MGDVMRSRLSVGVAAVLMALVAGSVRMATAAELNRLAAFAARQDLCDAVSVARADGRIDRSERYTLLLDAKDLLTPDEYESFKHALNRISPPVPVAKRSAKSKRLATVAQEQSPPVATSPLASTIIAEAMVPAESQAAVEETTIPAEFKAEADEATIPAEPNAEVDEATLPDRMASAVGAR
jgi:hypothetical protein